MSSSLIVNPFTHLRAQVKACLEREARLSPEERRQHQWQFLTTVGSLVYIVGKGGANTMFYKIGSEDRKLCQPKEMLDIISAWAGAKYSGYAIGKSPKVFSHGVFTDEKQALAIKDAPAGSFIIGLKPDGKMARLYVLKSGLVGTKWVPFKKGGKGKKK